MLRVTWSDGLLKPKVALNQVRIPPLTITIDPVAVTVTVTGGPTCFFTPNQTTIDSVEGWKVGASLIYIGWWKNQLAVLAGSWDNGVYVSTATKLSITGQCVPIDTESHLNDQSFLPKELQAIVWIGTYGMPRPTSGLGGACTSSIQSYSMGPLLDPNIAEPAGFTSVMDFRGVSHLTTLSCP
jgi:hypothetical protein